MLVTLLVERESGRDACFEIEEIEQIKGIPKGNGKVGNLGYYDRLRVPIIENTAQYVLDLLAYTASSVDFVCDGADE